MLISMTPNDEVKTIHASLNDGSLRKWEFEPYTENGKIELTDQDYATIQSIKGNTVKFNQLNPNNALTQSGSGITATNNNDGSWTFNGTATAVSLFNPHSGSLSLKGGHKYFLKGCPSGGSNSSYELEIRVTGGAIVSGFIDTGNGALSTIPSDGDYQIRTRIANGYTCNNVVITPMLFDLTAMGIDNLTTVEQVETWLSNNIGLLPYYDYTPGTLIPFKGTGLKVTGKNLLLGIENGTIIGTGEKNTSTIRCRTESIFSLKAGTYTISVQTSISGKTLQISYQYWATDKQDGTNTRLYDSGWVNVPLTITLTNDTFFSFVIHYTDNSAITYTELSAQLEFGSTATVYEPYIESTLSLPISAYFPTGMKEAGSVYDELTESKAITRIGSRAYQSGDEDDTSVITDGTTTYYALATPTETTINPPLDLTYDVWDSGTEQILPVNSSTPTTSSMKATIEYPDRTEEVNFLYKQTAFDSAIPQFSLVCKNQELPMALEDGKLICECDSSITNESGFFDCKVKMQDLDSVAYSQKIQLHVERGIND